MISCECQQTAVVVHTGTDWPAFITITTAVNAMLIRIVRALIAVAFRGGIAQLKNKAMLHSAIKKAAF